MSLRPPSPHPCPPLCTVPVRRLRGPPGPAGSWLPPSCPHGTLKSHPGQEQLRRGCPRGLPPQAEPAASLQGSQPGRPGGPRDTAHRAGPGQGPKHQPQAGLRRVRPALWLDLAYLLSRSGARVATWGGWGPRPLALAPQLHTLHLCLPLSITALLCEGDPARGAARKGQGSTRTQRLCQCINHGNKHHRLPTCLFTGLVSWGSRAHSSQFHGGTDRWRGARMCPGPHSTSEVAPGGAPGSRGGLRPPAPQARPFSGASADVASPGNLCLRELRPGDLD